MTDVEDQWSLDPSMVVLPVASEAGPTEDPRFSLSSPNAFGAVEASLYQLQLLRSFEDPQPLGSIIDRYPFEKAASERFLGKCRWAGLLRRTGADGHLEPPDRIPAKPPFAGAPPFQPEAPAAFTVVGIPYDGNTTGLPGARFGPQALRAAAEGVRYALHPVTQLPMGFYDFAAGRSYLKGVTLADAGDVFTSPGEDGPELYSRVTDVIRDLVEVGTIPMIIGGDHSLTAPILAGFPAEPMQIIHLDAHTDLGTIERSDRTGLHHGNVFSVVLDELPNVEHLRQLGLRGIIEAEAVGDETRALGIGMDRLREDGIDAALEGLHPDMATYVSIDIDVVDPAFAPSTGTPVPSGLYPHELKAILRKAGQKVSGHRRGYNGGCSPSGCV